jgi:hypothetical protein
VNLILKIGCMVMNVIRFVKRENMGDQIEQEVGAAEIFQNDELTSTFNVQTEMLEESLLGD